MAELVKKSPAMQETWVWSLGWEDPLEKLKATFFIFFFKGFPDSSIGQESACNAGDPSWIPGSGKSSGEGISYLLQYSWASLVAQLGENLSAVQETWVLSLGLEDPWRRERLPTPVFWPGEFHGLYSPWKESDTVEWLSSNLQYLVQYQAHSIWSVNMWTERILKKFYEDKIPRARQDSDSYVSGEERSLVT